MRDRYDGTRRNPWNEVECGNHYARSLASWAVLVALSGAQYDASQRSLDFTPASAGDLTSFFSTGSGWGRVEIDDDGATLFLDAGSLTLDRLSVRGRALVAPTGTIALEAGDSIRATFTPASERAPR